MRTFVALAMVLLLVPTTLDGRRADPVAPAAPALPPNILLINTDDQRADTLDMMPKLREWFTEGREFPNAQVNIPSCCPSRSTLISGRYAHNNGVRRQDDARHLAMDATLPAYLQKAGYATMMAGKFLNSWPLAEAPPYFDEYATIHGGYGSFNVFTGKGDSGRLLRLHPDAADPDLYSTRWLADRLGTALDNAHRNRPGRPWFAYFAPYAPHPPATPEPRYATTPVRPCLQPDEPDRHDKPPYVRKARYQPDAYARFCADQLRTLISVDDAVDALLRRVQSYGELDRTLVIFTSDNGYLWGEHSRTEKFAPYLPSVRVPLLLRWPAGGITPGVDERLASTVDISATVLAAAGVRPPAGKPPLDGRSLLDSAPIRTVFNEYWLDLDNSYIPDWAAVFDGRWHFIEYFSPTGKRTFTELYDVRADPAENRNLAVEKAVPANGLVRKLRTRLAAWRLCRGVMCRLLQQQRLTAGG